MILTDQQPKRRARFCHKAIIVLTALVLATFLLPTRISNYLLMAIGVVWLIDFDYRRKLACLKMHKRWVFTLILLCYYGMCLIGCFYSENTTIASSILERKTMVLVGALVFLTLNDTLFTSKDFKCLQYAF